MRDSRETAAAVSHHRLLTVESSGGGSRGAYVLARLSARPFKTTFGNLRISDITTAFSRRGQARSLGQ
ncbi:MAG: hypothetical protein ACT4QD_05860 [Acidobacteriota bacterium]